MSGKRSLRFSSEAAMPASMRALYDAQLQQMRQAAPTAAPVQEAKRAKYSNVITHVDGIRFDSKREARYYEQLKLRKAAGEVEYWLRQTAIHLPGGTRYVIDFLVFFTDPARKPEYVDVKGRETKEFKIKKREVEHHYPFRVVIA